MDISVFGNTGQPLESATVRGNILIGGGGWNGTDRHGVHVGSPASTSLFPNAYTVVTICNNIIRDSLRAGLKIGATYENVTVWKNTIDHPANQGIWIASGVTGTGSFSMNRVSNLLEGQIPFQNDSPDTFTTTLTDSEPETQAHAISVGLLDTRFLSCEITDEVDRDHQRLSRKDPAGTAFRDREDESVGRRRRTQLLPPADQRQQDVLSNVLGTRERARPSNPVGDQARRERPNRFL
jgi:hypothetical protein